MKIGVAALGTHHRGIGDELGRGDDQAGEGNGNEKGKNMP